MLANAIPDLWRKQLHVNVSRELLNAMELAMLRMVGTNIAENMRSLQQGELANVMQEHLRKKMITAFV